MKDGLGVPHPDENFKHCYENECTCPSRETDDQGGSSILITGTICPEHTGSACRVCPEGYRENKSRNPLYQETFIYKNNFPEWAEFVVEVPEFYTKKCDKLYECFCEDGEPEVGCTVHDLNAVDFKTNEKYRRCK